MTKHIKIYSTTSLDAATVARILPSAQLVGAIKPYDLEQDITNSVNIVGVIDGVVTSSELLQALGAGMRVYGAGTMALHAVELEAFGMIGTGEIFNWIKSQRHFRDDYVAEANMPDYISYADFSFSLNYLTSRKVLNISRAKSLLKAYDELHFRDRTIGNLKAKFDRNDPLMEDIEAIREKIFLQKTVDGKQLLYLIKAMLPVIEENNKRLNIGD